MESHLDWARRVLRLVRDLHEQGYQLLRISPGMAPSGCYWRCAVTPKSNILKRPPARRVCRLAA